MLLIFISSFGIPECDGCILSVRLRVGINNCGCKIGPFVVGSDVCKVDKAVHSQRYSEWAPLPWTGWYLLALDHKWKREFWEAANQSIVLKVKSLNLLEDQSKTGCKHRCSDRELHQCNAFKVLGLMSDWFIGSFLDNMNFLFVWLDDKYWLLS